MGRVTGVKKNGAIEAEEVNFRRPIRRYLVLAAGVARPPATTFPLNSDTICQITTATFQQIAPRTKFPTLPDHSMFYFPSPGKGDRARP